MEIHERIRNLRKHLHLSQTAFGQKLGVSRSVINNIELNTLARPEQKLSLIKLMCKEFNVNEEWILNGTEPMFLKTPDSVMEQLKTEFNLDKFDYGLVYEYLKLSAEKRSAIREYLQNIQKYLENSESTSKNLYEVEEEEFFIPDTPEELERLYPPVELPKSHKKIG